MKKRSMLPSIFESSPGMPGSFGSLRKEIDRLFEDFSRDMPVPSMFASSAGHVPSMDVRDGEKEVTLNVELPGVEEKDIDISVAGQTVTISGEKKSESEKKDGEVYHSERSYGSFRRSLQLPFNIDGEKVKAKFDKGVLSVTVPKPKEAVASSKKISIGK